MTDEMFSFRKNRKLYRVKINDIVYIERKKGTLRIHMADAAIMELNYGSLSKILREAADDRLLLCSRSVIVNRDYIYAVDPTNHYVILRDKREPLELGCYFREKVIAGLAKRENEFLLRKDNIRYVIRVENLVYAQSSRRMLQIFLQDGAKLSMSQKPIEYILRQVKTDRLIRCARGVLVNYDYIEKIDIINQKIMLIDGKCLEIGKKYVEILAR